MKAMIGCACAGTVLGGMYLHGDLSGGQIYNVPLHDAYLRAQAAHIDGATMNVGPTSRPDTERYADEAVKWAYSVDGKSVGRSSRRSVLRGRGAPASGSRSKRAMAKARRWSNVCAPS